MNSADVMLPSDSSPVKILHLVTGLEIGDGIVEMVLAMTSRLDRRRWSPLVCGLRGSGSYRRFFEDRQIPVFVGDAGSPLGVRQYARSWTLIRQVRRILKREKVSILHAHNLFAGMIGWAASIGMPEVRRMVTMHGNTFFESWKDSAWQSTLRSLFFRQFFRRWERVIGVSEAVRQWVLEFDPTHQRVSVVHNGIRAERFANPGDGEFYRREWGVPPNAQVVGTVGTLEKVKGGDRLLRAASLVLARRPDTYFIFIGGAAQHEPETHAELNDLTKQLGLAGHVVFTDRLPNIRDALAALDLFVFASTRSGFGLALAEAMYLGKPSVAASVGGIPEIVEDGVSGLLVPVEGTLILSEAIQRILADPSLAAALGGAARQRIEGHFLAEHMAAGYEKLYRPTNEPAPAPAARALQKV